jgi:hypothetical protein
MVAPNELGLETKARINKGILFLMILGSLIILAFLVEKKALGPKIGQETYAPCISVVAAHVSTKLYKWYHGEPSNNGAVC